METQDELFHEDVRDAFRHVIKALGGCEAVGEQTHPAKTRKAAGSWTSDCFNPERDAKPDIEDWMLILRLARKAGIHTAIYQICDEAGYERPKLAASKSPRTLLLEKQSQLADEQLRVQQEIDRIDAAKELKSVP